MNTFKSLAFKNAIIYLVIFLIGLGILGFLLLQSSSKRIIENAENQLLHSGDLVEIQVREYIDELVNDLMFLSENPNLKRYLARSSDENYNVLNDEFLSLISSNSDYGQIRYIHAASGKEVVRVDRLNGNPVITPTDALQVKKNRPYFDQTIRLSQESIYFSPIDLNKEFGKISKPYTPTLRIAKPIYFNGAIQGIIVINTDLSKLFEKLNASVGNDFILRIYNEDGYYLLHEVKDSVFTFEFEADGPQVVFSIDDFQKGIERSDDALISKHRISLSQMGYDLFYEIKANKADLLASYYLWMKHSILRILLIAFIFTSFAFFILRRQFRTLQKLTASIKEYPENRKVSALPTRRNDEIGELARSFEETVNIINKQIASIESEKQKAETAEKDKSNFIENITHEIRNPLQSIIGLSTILEQNSPKPNQIDILNSIRLNTTNLNGLVNSILDYQNMLKGNVSIEKQYTDVGKLIQELVTGISIAADQKAVKIDTVLDEKLDSFEVNLDRLRISQILNNLISNAISHTPPNGKIKVEVLLKEMNNGTAAIQFLVSDNGVGMSASEITKVRERYYTKSAKNVFNANQGLGLTIVNELLNIMDSELVIESEQSIGSTFSFKISDKIRAKIGSISEFEFSDNLVEGKKVLIIEDDQQVLNLYDYYFEKGETQYISNLDDLSTMKSEHFDIVITDFYLESNLLSDYYNVLHGVMNDSTSLIVVSGRRPDMTQLEKEFPNAVFNLKPVTKISLFKSIVAANTFARFGKPNIDVVKADYDFDASKYERAFSLLLSEWKVYKERLIESIRNRNPVQLEEVVHKLNNTLRRLRLSKLEAYLLKVKQDLNDSNFDNEKQCKRIAEIMDVYFTHINKSID